MSRLGEWFSAIKLNINKSFKPNDLDNEIQWCEVLNSTSNTNISDLKQVINLEEDKVCCGIGTMLGAG